MFEPRPEPTATDTPHSYGLALFAYLLRGHVNAAEVYGMLTRSELELAHHASMDALPRDVEPVAASAVAIVRLRILQSVERLRIEHAAGVAALAALEPSEPVATDDNASAQPPAPTNDQLIVKFARALVHLSQQHDDDNRNGGARVPVVTHPKPQPPAGSARKPTDDIQF